MTKNLKMFLLFIIPILLIIISIPINRKAFALFFGGEGWVLLLLAIAVGAILVFLSHTIGYLIKVRSNGSHYIISLSSITVISIIYLLALMRQKLADVEQAAGTFDLIAKGANIQEGFFYSSWDRRINIFHSKYCNSNNSYSLILFTC